MKKYISAFIMVVIMFVLQTTVFEHLRPFGVAPNLILAVTTIFAFMYGPKEGMFAGVVSGFLVDVLYNRVIGVSIILYSVVGYITGTTRNLYFKQDIYVPMAVLGLSDLLFNFFYYICYFLMRGKIEFFTYLKEVIIPETIYTIIIGTFIYLFVKWMDSKFHPAMKYPINIKEFEDNDI